MRRVGDEHHVRLVDGLEAADRRTVERLAVGEEVLVERLGRDVEVLHDTGQVAEADVDELDALVLDVGRSSSGLANTYPSWAVSQGVDYGCTGHEATWDLMTGDGRDHGIAPRYPDCLAAMLKT